MTELRNREPSRERSSRNDRPRRRNTSSASDDRRRRRSNSADGRSMSPPAQKRRRRSPTDSRSPPRRNDKRRERSQDGERRDRRPDRGSYKDTQSREDRRDQRRRSRSRDGERRRDRRQSHSASPARSYRDRSPRRDDRSNDRRIDGNDSPPPRRNRAPLPSQVDSFKDEGGVIKTYRNGRGNTENAVAPPTEKEKINLRPTGLLATEANTLSFGTQKITLRYHQPPEARKPDPKRAQWRLFIFKGTETLDTIDLFEKSCWLVGREKAVADLWVQSPGVSGQHAVLQFRAVDDRGGKKVVKLYVLDLESSNGTVLNGEKIPDRRYVEVRGGDVLQFGGSGRDYVIMLPGVEEKVKE